MVDIEYLAGVQYITDGSGERSGVILSLEQYNQLLEDLEDLAILAERRDETTIPHEQLVAQLKVDGLLPD